MSAQDVTLHPVETVQADVRPVAHLVWLQGRPTIDDVVDYYEVARPGDKSVDGSKPLPVYTQPIKVREQWQPISTFTSDILGPFTDFVFCGHADKKWIRMGRFYVTLKRWYYSGTNERSQWAQVEGDEPTHWQPLPKPPAYFTASPLVEEERKTVDSGGNPDG